MPISSRFLKFYRPQADGRARVREVHVDALGNEITRQYLTTLTLADIEMEMNLRDMTETLSERDLDDVLAWVLVGNDPNTFDYTARDVIKNKAEERITKIFARSRGEDALRLAWWVDSLGTPRWNAIITRLGWATERKDRVKARAVTLNASIAEYDAEEDV